MPRRLREVQGDEMGDFVKFDQLGDSVEGVFEKERTADGQFGQQQVFDIRTAEGQLLTVTGTWDIKSKMAKVPPGSFVRITYVSQKEMGLNRDGSPKNPMKVFRVEVDEEAPTATGTGSRKPQF